MNYEAIELWILAEKHRFYKKLQQISDSMNGALPWPIGGDRCNHKELAKTLLREKARDSS